MRNRRHVFNQLDIESSGLQRSDRAFATRTWALDPHFYIAHPKLSRLLGCLLSSALASERSAFAAALETRGSSSRPAKRIALGVGDRDGRIVERRVNVHDSIRDVASDTLLLVGLCHRKALKTESI